MLIIGREEWVSLNDYNIGPIIAKVDTGAKTSSLHACIIRRSGDLLTFQVPGFLDECQAHIIDRREVLSPDRGVTQRYVVSTSLSIGAHTWQIELSLADRTGLSCPMILGREALRRKILVDPNRAHLIGTASASRVPNNNLASDATS